MELIVYWKEQKFGKWLKVIEEKEVSGRLITITDRAYGEPMAFVFYDGQIKEMPLREIIKTKEFRKGEKHDE